MRAIHAMCTYIQGNQSNLSSHLPTSFSLYVDFLPTSFSLYIDFLYLCMYGTTYVFGPWCMAIPQSMTIAIFFVAVIFGFLCLRASQPYIP